MFLKVSSNILYTPYGEVLTGGDVSRFDYEGKEFDSVVGDYDFNFRKYKAEWGLFLQPDTLIQDIYNPQDLNRYSFERGNPYKYIDPDGHLVGLILLAVFTVVNLYVLPQAIPSVGGYIARQIGIYFGEKSLEEKVPAPKNKYDLIIQQDAGTQTGGTTYIPSPKAYQDYLPFPITFDTLEIRTAIKEKRYSPFKADTRGKPGEEAHFDEEGKFHQSTGGYYRKHPLDVSKSISD